MGSKEMGPLPHIIQLYMYGVLKLLTYILFDKTKPPTRKVWESQRKIKEWFSIIGRKTNVWR